MTSSAPFFCDTCGAANRVQALFCSVCGHSLHGNASNSSTLTGALQTQHILKQRYIVLNQAGRGGFGAVYRASDTQFANRQVAIKEMSQSALSPEEMAEATDAFKREALLLASLTHPHLPRIYEQFTDQGRIYLVMDFIEGETLEDHLNQPGKKLMPLEKALDIAMQLCSVLDYLHTRQPPIIFRDLKPANIMLSPRGHVYLIDFGIARHFKPGQSKDTAALGSTGYAAPEQYGKAQTTARADIYALGATLHQMLTGDDPSVSPFQFAPLRLAHQPAGLDTLLMSMVSIDVNKRPASIELVRQELQRISTRHMLAQTHALPVYTPSAYLPPLSHNPAKTTSAKSARQNSRQQIQPQLNTHYICFGHKSRITSISWSPDGKMLASASYDKTVRLWEAAGGAHVRIYSGHSQRVNAVAWSPDSKRLVSASDDGTVQVWEAVTGRRLCAYYGHNGQVNSVSWSPDGKLIASAGTDKTVQVWNALAGQVLYTYREHTDKIMSVSWSPDGKRIASAGKDRQVHIWDSQRDQHSHSLLSTLLSFVRRTGRINKHMKQINAVAWSPDGKRIASVSNDQRILVGDMVTGISVFLPRSGSLDMKNIVAWAPTGKHLAVGGNNKTVEVWNTLNKSQPFIYHGHNGYVIALAWSPDGSRIASGGADHSLQVWQAV